MAFKSSSWILPLATLRTSFNKEHTNIVAGFIYTIADDPIRVIWPAGTGGAGKDLKVESAFYKCEIVDTKHIIDALVDKSVADSLLSASQFTNMNELGWTLISIRSYCVQALLFKNVGSDPKGIIRPVLIVKQFIGFPHATLGLPVGELRDHIMENKDAQALMLELKSQNAFCSLYVRPWTSPEQESRGNNENKSVEEKTFPGRGMIGKNQEDENVPSPLYASPDISDQCPLSEAEAEDSQKSEHQVFDESLRTALRRSCHDDSHLIDALLNMASGDLDSFSEFVQSESQQLEDEGTPGITDELESHRGNKSPKTRMTTLIPKRRPTPDSNAVESRVQSVVSDGKIMNDRQKTSESEKQAPYTFIFKDENSQKVFEVEGSQRSIGHLAKFIEKALEVNCSQDSEEGTVPTLAPKEDIGANICDGQDSSSSESSVVQDVLQSTAADPPLEFSSDGIKPVKIRRISKSGLKKRAKRKVGTRTTVLIKVQTPDRKITNPKTAENLETSILSESQESNGSDGICAVGLHSQAIDEVKSSLGCAYFTRSLIRESNKADYCARRSGTNSNLTDKSYIKESIDTRREPGVVVTGDCEEGIQSSQVGKDPAGVLLGSSEKKVDTSRAKIDINMCMLSGDREDANKELSSSEDKNRSLTLVPLNQPQDSGKEFPDSSTSRKPCNPALPATNSTETMPEASTREASAELQNLSEEANDIKTSVFSPCLLPDIYGEQLLGWEYFEKSQGSDQVLAAGATQNARGHVEEPVRSSPCGYTDNGNGQCAVELLEKKKLRSTIDQAESNDAPSNSNFPLLNRLLEAITNDVTVDRSELREFVINYWTWRVSQQAE